MMMTAKVRAALSLVTVKMLTYNPEKRQNWFSGCGSCFLLVLCSNDPVRMFSIVCAMPLSLILIVTGTLSDSPTSMGLPGYGGLSPARQFRSCYML